MFPSNPSPLFHFQLKLLIRSGVLGDAEIRAASSRLLELDLTAAVPCTGSAVDESSDPDILFISEPTKTPVCAGIDSTDAACDGGVAEGNTRVRALTALHVQRFLSRVRRGDSGDPAILASWIARGSDVVVSGSATTERKGNILDSPANQPANARTTPHKLVSGPLASLLAKQQLLATAKLQSSITTHNPISIPPEVSSNCGVERIHVQPAAVAVSSTAHAQDPPDGALVIDLCSQSQDSDASPEPGIEDSANAEGEYSAKFAGLDAHPSTQARSRAATSSTLVSSDIRRYTTPTSALGSVGSTLPRNTGQRLDSFLVWRLIAPGPRTFASSEDSALYVGREVPAAFETLPPEVLSNALPVAQLVEGQSDRASPVL